MGLGRPCVGQAKDGMFISTRRRFCAGDNGWDRYSALVGGLTVKEVRSLDVALNPDVDDCGNLECGVEIVGALRWLPRPKDDGEFYLLIVDVEREGDFEDGRWRLLGHDLSDWTWTSSAELRPLDGCARAGRCAPRSVWAFVASGRPARQSPPSRRMGRSRTARERDRLGAV